jgi:hypothetical protein
MPLLLLMTHIDNQVTHRDKLSFTESTSDDEDSHYNITKISCGVSRRLLPNGTTATAFVLLWLLHAEKNRMIHT